MPGIESRLGRCGAAHAGDFSNTVVQGKLVHDMRYLASVVTQCFTAFGELLALHKRFAELSGGVARVSDMFETLRKATQLDDALLAQPHIAGTGAHLLCLFNCSAVHHPARAAAFVRFAFPSGDGTMVLTSHQSMPSRPSVCSMVPALLLQQNFLMGLLLPANSVHWTMQPRRA